MKILRRLARWTLPALAAVAVLHAEAQAPVTKITYAIATRDIDVSYSFATLPIALGYFKEEGLDVSVVPGQNSSTAMQLVLTRRADVSVNPPQVAMVKKATTGLPLVSFYAVSRYTGNRILVNPESPVTTVAQLKGRKVGVMDLAGNTTLYLRMRLQEVGLTLDDVTLISTGYGTPAAEALKKGAVDALVDFSSSMVRKEVAGYKLRALATPDLQNEAYSYNMFAHEDYVQQHPQVLARLGRAIAKATVFMKTNPEAAVRIFWKQFPDRAPKDLADKAALERDLKILAGQAADMGVDRYPATFKWGQQSQDVFGMLQQQLLDTAQLERGVDPAVFFTNKMVDQFNDFNTAAVEAQARSHR